MYVNTQSRGCIYIHTHIHLPMHMRICTHTLQTFTHTHQALIQRQAQPAPFPTDSPRVFAPSPINKSRNSSAQSIADLSAQPSPRVSRATFSSPQSGHPAIRASAADSPGVRGVGSHSVVGNECLLSSGGATVRANSVGAGGGGGLKGLRAEQVRIAIRCYILC